MLLAFSDLYLVTNSSGAGYLSIITIKTGKLCKLSKAYLVLPW